jgi:acyl phosphate:glycerol-3-phosphate acyltransferase
VNLLVLLVGYFAGAIPFGVIVAKRRGVDIRQKGSGNIGATNVGRVLGLASGLLVLVLDALKGVAAVMVATRLSGMDPIVAMAGFAAILGHCFSPFLEFKGGKGVATALGVFIVISPALAIVAVAVFLVVAGRWRIPAVGSLAGVSAAAVYAFATGQQSDVKLLALGTFFLLLYTHRSNLSRLLTTVR